MSNLYDANYQWSTRPDDERFASLREMFDATKRYRDNARAATVPYSILRVETDDKDIKLIGKAEMPATLTHYAFGQLARRIGAPAEYLRSLPATLAVQNLNHGLKKVGNDPENKAAILFHQNGKLVTRAVTSESYDRVWDCEIVSRIMSDLVPEGWVVPPARPVRPGQKGTRRAVAADILPNQKDFGLAVKEGDEIAPAGLYASDHDMFAFLVNMTDPVFDGAKFLNRGVIVQNSEVGDKALKFKFFTFDNVCGNHIIWDVGQVSEVSIRHVKSADEVRGRTLQNAMSKWNIMVKKMATPAEIEANIKAAKAFEIASTKEDVIEAVFGFAKKKNLTLLNRATLDAGYEVAARTPRYGAPTTVWGMVNGLTEYSQQTGHTDTRNDLDVQAGKLMEIAF
jgi:hypothetical protein